MRFNPSLRYLPPLLAALCASAMAPAAEPSWLGEANCRIATLEPAPKKQFVNWDGACANGHASGKGVLTWRSAASDKISLEATLVNGAVIGEGILKTKDFTYTGTLRNGLPHGQGYFAYAHNKGWYEGDVADGLPHGKGIYLKVDRSRYAGEWALGKRNGWGEATFATGGSYTGAWKDDQFDGQGKIVHAGSGRSYEGQFKDGRVAGQPEPERDRRRYGMKTGTAGILDFANNQIRATGPVNYGWDKLTPAQKNTVRENYPALEAGDDPPYPLNGTRPLFDSVQKANQAMGALNGHLVVHALIGKDGAPLGVTTYGSPHPELARVVSQLMMLERYKPASCRGEPCEMVYPLHFWFSVSN